MIAEATIQAVREAARIEDVVSDFVALRKRGVNLIGLCPFHNERTPSFHINPVRGIFKCFGCGKGGDVFTFLREQENMSFNEATQWLAKRYHIEVIETQHSPEQIIEQQEAETLHIINEFAGKYYAWLINTERGKAVAGQYLQSRGIEPTSIEKYGLGYAMGPDDLLQWLRKRNYSIPHAVRVGLCNQGASRDFLQERIIFPIHSLSGKIIAFAGRIIPSPERALSLASPKRRGFEPKYLNTPESDVYQKSRILYGLFQARKSIRQQDECILVEGYLDVIALHQNGIENVVASCGTALTEDQLHLIRRNTNNLIILYDGDPAGISATLRGLDIALEQDLNIKIVLLPEGEDPDSFIRKVGGEQFRNYLATQAKDFVLFKASLLWNNTQSDPVKKAEAIRNIGSSIAKIPDAIKRNIYIRECAAQMKVSESVLTSEVIKMVSTGQQQSNRRQVTRTKVADDPLSTAASLTTPQPILSEINEDYQEEAIIRLLIQHGTQRIANEETTVAEYLLDNLGDVENIPDLFEHPLYREIVKEFLETNNEKKILTEYYFTSHPSPSIRDLTQRLITEDWPISERWSILEGNSAVNEDVSLSIEARQSLARFTIHKLTRLWERNHERIKQCPPDDMEAMDKYFRIGMKIKQARNQIASDHSIVII